MVETTEEYRNRINQIANSVGNEPYLKDMRDNIAEGISKTGNRQADIEVRQDTLETDFVAVQQDASSTSPSGAEVAVARAGFNTLDERLTTKEQEVTAQLAQNEIETKSKRLQGENTKDDTKGTFDSANFAGQGLGKSAPIGNVMHHYTDGISFQIDNVGDDNPILILKNAHNPDRRPDKSSDFVGTGDFITALEAVPGENSKKLFVLSREGNFYWFDKKDTIVFGANKEDDNKAAFQFTAYKKHLNLFQLMNATGGFELTIKHPSNNKLTFESGSYATGGMEFTTITGGIDFAPANKTMYMTAKVFSNDGVGSTYNRVLTSNQGTTANRPTTDLFTGKLYYDTTLQKPIWYNGTVWKDAMSVSV